MGEGMTARCLPLPLGMGLSQEELPCVFFIKIIPEPEKVLEYESIDKKVTDVKVSFLLNQS
jgi:hypothetical protein